MGFKLPRTARLRKTWEFDQVYRQGRRLRGQGFSLICRPAGMARNRLGVSIHRKLRGATRRNRIKRLFKEAFRLNRAIFPAACDMVVTVRPDFHPTGLGAVMEAFERLFDAPKGEKHHAPGLTPPPSRVQ